MDLKESVNFGERVSVDSVAGRLELLKLESLDFFHLENARIST
jgi:hypothetical protein